MPLFAVLNFILIWSNFARCSVPKRRTIHCTTFILLVARNSACAPGCLASVSQSRSLGSLVREHGIDGSALYRSYLNRRPLSLRSLIDGMLLLIRTEPPTQPPRPILLARMPRNKSRGMATSTMNGRRKIPALGHGSLTINLGCRTFFRVVSWPARRFHILRSRTRWLCLGRWLRETSGSR